MCVRIVRVLRKCSVALTCSCGGFVRLGGRYFRCRCRPRRRRGAEESASGRGIGIGHGLPRSRAGRTASRAAAAAAAACRRQLAGAAAKLFPGEARCAAAQAGPTGHPLAAATVAGA